MHFTYNNSVDVKSSLFVLTFKNLYYPTLEILSLFIAGHIPVQGIFLGHSGYALKSYLLTPNLNPIEPYRQRFNTAHCRTRVLIEHTFGILYRRFSCRHSEIRLSPQRACNVVVVCSITLPFFVGISYQMWTLQISRMTES